MFLTHAHLTGFVSDISVLVQETTVEKLKQGKCLNFQLKIESLIAWFIDKYLVLNP